MTPLTEDMIATVCEMEGIDEEALVRRTLALWFGPESAWAWTRRARAGAKCPLDGESEPWCDWCSDPDCTPVGTTLLREVCCVLWPWAADKIRHGWLGPHYRHDDEPDYRYDDGPDGIPF